MQEINLQDFSSLEQFNYKILCYGESGVGKTHLGATYTKGPVHICMMDPGGEKTILKMARDGHKVDHIKVYAFGDRDPRSPKAFREFWDWLRIMESKKFFDELASQNGLLIIDSMTTLAQADMDMIVRDAVVANSKRSGNYVPQLQDYGIQKAHMLEFVRIINALPCAVYLTAHIKSEQIEGTESFRFYPNMVGTLKQDAGLYFSEVWMMSMLGQKRTINLVGSTAYQAKSRIAGEKLQDVTMDDIYDLSMGKALTHKKGSTPNKKAAPAPEIG